MRRFLRIFAEALGAILALIYLWSWIAPNTARLRVLVKSDDVQIPSTYREYLHAIDASYPDPNRKALIWIHDAAAVALKQQNEPLFLGLESQLQAMRAFADCAPIFRFADPHVITVKIVNVGWKVANNVKVFFPDGGFVEIAKDGALVIAEQRKGWIDLQVLEPSSQFIATMWTTGEREGVRVISDEGTANLREWYVSRDKNRWVIGFGPPEIMLFSGAAIVGLGLLSGFVLLAAELRSERAAETQKENEHPPSNSAGKRDAS